MACHPLLFRLRVLLLLVFFTITTTTATWTTVHSEFNFRTSSLRNVNVTVDRDDDNDSDNRHHSDYPELDTDLETEAATNDRLLIVTVGGFVDSQSCWDVLSQSDTNQDGVLERDEYVEFALALEPGVLNNIEEYTDLPTAYQLAFVGTACLCQNALAGGSSETEDCCVGDSAVVRVPVAPDQQPNATEIAYLYTACSLTSGAADQVRTSAEPTLVPTGAPTQAPPTDPPLVLVVPTAPPSASPVYLTAFPSSAPPSATPTVAPTTATPSVPPTAGPTITPRPTTITGAPAVPTTPPTASPSRSPVPAPVRVDLNIDYDIALRDGVALVETPGRQTEYLGNLVVGLDTVAAATATGRRRHLRSVRILQAVPPSRLDRINRSTCPTDLRSNESNEFVRSNTTLCQTVSAVVRWDVTDPAEAQELEAGVQRSIADGSLQTELDGLDWSVNDNVNPVLVLTGLATTTPIRAISPDTSLGPGAITGISLAALFFVLLPIGFYIFNRDRPDEEEKPPEYMEAQDNKVMDEDELDSPSLGSDAARSPTPGEPVMGATTLGAGVADYGKADRRARQSSPGMLLDDEEDDDDDEATSSNAGSSGWSSSAGISSLNTGSMDDSADAAVAAGATLAGIGLASTFSRSYKDGSVARSDTEDGQSENRSASRDQLDALIESGDWAAVGATAALLAAASDSQSGTDMSRNSGSRTKSRDSSVDAARAAELDHLVDAGDWEGVVAAAAKFEADTSEPGTGSKASSRSRTNSSIDTSAESGSLTDDPNTVGSPSVATSISDSASKIQKREEVRSEVEALVRRVVPEEIDNVDEMMNQFKGREEELVETLRTMQERAVAQKARASGQRAAKMEAKRNVQRGVVPGSSNVVQKVASLEIKEAAAGTGGVKAAGVGMVAAVPSPQSTDANENLNSITKARTALEEAIEAGDWEAVGAAAALIDDNSATTGSGSSIDVDRIAGTTLSVSTSGTNRSRSSLTGVNAERAAELDALIDRGDWSGVVAASNKFTDGDSKEAGIGKRSKEEEEALKEAELWMKIAEQKKAEGATDAGASDAAEWAIQRSLSQLKDAEKKSAGKGGTGEDEV